MSDENSGNSQNRGSGAKKRSILPLLIGLPLIAIVAAGAIYFTSTSGSETADDDGQSQQNVQDEQADGESAGQREPGGGGSGDELTTPTLGESDAPVVMQEFSDYQ